MKTPKEAMELIENMAASDHAILRDIMHIPTKTSLLELSSQDALLAQNKLLAKQFESLTETLSKLPTQLKQLNRVIQQLCKLEAVVSVEGLANLVVVWLKMMQLKKLIIWQTRRYKDFTQVVF